MSCPSSIWRRDSNQRNLDREPPPITTRPGLPPWKVFFFHSSSFIYLFLVFWLTNLNHLIHLLYLSPLMHLFLLFHLLLVHKVLNSVTRFGEISPLWHNIKKHLSFWKSSFSIWKHFELTFGNFKWFWPIFQFCKYQNIKQILQQSGHTSSPIGSIIITRRFIRTF